MQIVFSLFLPREEATVPLVRRLCRDALRSLGVVDDCIHDLEVAVTEACSNVLKHAVGGHEEYEVSLELSGRVGVIKVADRAADGFDPAEAASQVAELAAESGRGIQLMKALVDDLRFESKPELGTVVQLEKELVFDQRSLVGRFVPASN